MEEITRGDAGRTLDQGIRQVGRRMKNGDSGRNAGRRSGGNEVKVELEIGKCFRKIGKLEFEIGKCERC